MNPVNYSMGTINLNGNNTATSNTTNTNSGSSVITTDAFKKQPEFTLPTTKPDITPYDAIVQNSLNSLASYTTNVDTATQTQNNLLKTLTETMNNMGGREQYLQQQQDIAGVNTEQKQLDTFNARANDLIASLSALSNESKAIPLKAQQSVIGQGVTDAGLQPLTTAQLRENAIKALTLSSEGDALASQITNSETRLQRAKEKAQQAVDLKYKPLEEQLERVKTFLDINQRYVLEPADKKRIEATNIALQERERVLANKKEQDKRIEDMLINANTQGAPASSIAMARKLQAQGASSSDVATALGRYAGDYYKTELLKAQIQTEKAQQANYSANIRKINAEISNAENESKLPKPQNAEFVKNAVGVGDAFTKFKSALDMYNNTIKTAGTYATPFFGSTERADKNTARTNLLLAMKNLEQTGALDRGTVDVLSPSLPENAFFQTEDYQKRLLSNIENSVKSQVDYKINVLRGTSAFDSPEINNVKKLTGYMDYEKQTPETQAGKMLMNGLFKATIQYNMPTNTSTQATTLLNTLYPTKGN